MKNNWWPIILLLMVVLQVVFALAAEYNEDYLKAIYEMIWAFVFMFLLKEETNSG